MKDRAPIIVSDYDAFMANADAVSAKLGNNKSIGANAFSDGSVASFGGYSETFLKHEYQARFELDGRSIGNIHSRVIKPLSETAQRMGASFLSAGDGLEAPHITLQTARFGANLEDEEIQSRVAVLNNESKFNLVAAALKGRVIPFDRFVAGANGSFYMCSGQVVPETLKGRNTVSKLISRTFPTAQAWYSAGKSASELSEDDMLSLVEFRDITHCIVGRLTAPADTSALRALFAIAEEIDVSLQSQPLEVSIGKVVFDSTYNIVSEQAPNLISNN